MNKLDIFTKTYLNIITEDCDRFQYLDIIKATNIVTNNCKDMWVKRRNRIKSSC